MSLNSPVRSIPIHITNPFRSSSYNWDEMSYFYTKPPSMDKIHHESFNESIGNPLSAITLDINEIQSDIANILRKVGNLFNENNAPMNIDIAKYVYAVCKGIQKKIMLSQSTIWINHIDFLKYIHQSFYFDIIYIMMKYVPALTPQEYKYRAKNKISKNGLKDFLIHAMTLANFTIDDQNIENYITAYFDFPPLSSTYFYDRCKIYEKVKTYYYYVFKDIESGIEKDGEVLPIDFKYDGN